jgi:adenylate cyclase
VPLPTRTLAAIVFTDIVGYSKLVHRDDARALRLLGEHFRIVREAARRHGGREIKTIGDSVHLEFASAQAAAMCAIAIQQLHQQRNTRVEAVDRFDIRIGLHLGDVEHRDGDVYGDGVNIASRLQPLSPVGGVAISDDVRRQLPEELRHRFTSSGAQALKNIDTPVEVFVIEAASIAGIVIDTPAPSPSRARSPRLPPTWAIVTVAVIGLMMFIAKPWRHGPDGGERRAEVSKVVDKSIAVLPFESLSEDKSNAYFADGIQDQILTSLSRIGDLKVISRTSTQRYASKPDNLSQIARELGVAHILEGSVQRAGNRVRINVQLIKASDDSHLWAETFDRTLDDIFAVQSEVAEKIAGSLSARLTQSERAAIAQKPTDNVQAYAAYLKARALSAKVITTRDQADEVLGPLREAVKLDPDFALAWAELSRSAIITVWSGLDPSGEVSEEARQALVRAMALAPRLPMVQVARAYHLYYGDRDFAGAAAIVNSLKDELPGDAEVWITAGLLARRLGKWDQAIADFEHARKLLPNDSSLTFSLGVTHAAQFDFARGIEYMDSTLALQPGDPNALAAKFQYLVLLGDLAKAEAFLAKAPADSPVVIALRGILSLLRRDDAGATRLLRQAVESEDEARLDVWFDGYVPALVEWKLLLALAERRSGNGATATRIFREVKAQAVRALAGKLETPYVEAEWEFAAAMALAGLGVREESIARGERGAGLLPPGGDMAEEPQFQAYLARIYALNGDAARAVPIAKRLQQTRHGFMTKELLRVDPSWDAVRDDPAFQALINPPR